MPRASEICRMDAVTLAARVRAKELSAIEVADAVIAHMEEVEPHLHAFCTPAPDYARAAARQGGRADRRRARTRGRSRVCPSASRTSSAPRTCRPSRAPSPTRDFMPDEDDVTVERLKAMRVRSSSARPTCRSSATAARATTPCSRRRATRGTWSARPAAPARARAPQWRRASGRSRSAAMAAARCGFRRRSAGWWGSRRRWGGCRSIPVAATSATPASPAGRGSSISAR